MAALLACAVVVAVLAVGGGGSGAAGEGSGPAPSPAIAGEGPSPTEGGGAGLPTVGPRDVDVVFYAYLGGLRLPASPTAGPANREDHLASGYARTPMGAVMAAVNIAYRTGGPLGEPVYRPTIERQVTGAYQGALLRAATAEGRPDLPPAGEPLAGSDARLAGWRWESYSPDAAVVRYLLSQVAGPQTAYLAVRVELVWEGGDWKVVAPPGGGWENAGSAPAGTAGYHLFDGS